jgi:glycosyltransferase involved in cell wall biosynthesis
MTMRWSFITPRREPVTVELRPSPSWLFGVTQGVGATTTSTLDEFEFLDSTEGSVGRARNEAASRASGEWFIFIDDDTYLVGPPPPDDLDLAIPMYFPQYTNNILGDILYAATNVYNAAHLSPHALGPCIAVKSQLFRRTSGFSEKEGPEDIEFGLRIVRDYDDVKWGIWPCRAVVTREPSQLWLKGVV